MRVLFAPDSFKGTLNSVDVARALATGWSRARPQDEILFAPLADGGEGTLNAIEAAGGWDRRTASVSDPWYRPIEASWLISPNGQSAVIEMATASGLSLVSQADRQPTMLTSMGTGELIRAAIDAGARHLTLGIGGSATVDGGAGILTVLGAVFRRADGQPEVELPTPPMPILLIDIAAVDLSRLDPRLAEVDLRIACDVTNPLLGPHGAAAIYGPQKGASADDVELLEMALRDLARALEGATLRHERDTPGAGAAGGVGFALLCLRDRFRSLELVPGVDVVIELTTFDAKLGRADLVITGEGRIDAQTGFGKTALGVAKRAAAAGVRCFAVGGGVEPGGAAALAAVGAEAVAVHEHPISLADALAAGAAPLEACAERLARRLTTADGAARIEV